MSKECTCCGGSMGLCPDSPVEVCSACEIAGRWSEDGASADGGTRPAGHEPLELVGPFCPECQQPMRNHGADGWFCSTSGCAGAAPEDDTEEPPQRPQVTFTGRMAATVRVRNLVVAVHECENNLCISVYDARDIALEGGGADPMRVFEVPYW